MYINNYLRGRNLEEMGEMQESDRELIKDLDGATNRTQDNDVLYRSVDATAVFGNMSQSDYENLYNHLKYGDAPSPRVKAMLEQANGKTVTDAGYMSTKHQATPNSEREMCSEVRTECE